MMKSQLGSTLVRASIKAVEEIKNNDFSLDSFQTAFASFEGVDTSKIASALLSAGLVSKNAGKLTDAGLRVSDNINLQSATRRFLIEYISCEQPSWVYLAAHGRERFKNFCPDSRLLDVFFDAGTFGPCGPDIAAFWNFLSVFGRDNEFKRRLEIGQLGERLSIDFEKKRIDREPEWRALDNHDLGYDVLSWCDSYSDDRLLIEVKTTTKAKNANLYLTRNEWVTATSAKHHQFHLWRVLESGNQLAVVSASDMAQHLPDERTGVVWEILKISFDLFASEFIEVNAN